MLTIGVINQKGGVAKTTTAVNLAVGLARSGKRVLLVDLDPQSHATLAVRVNSEEVSAQQTVAALFYQGGVSDILRDTCEPNLKLIPASIHLATAVENLYSVLFRETKLRSALQAAAEHFDYAVLDNAATLGVLSVNAIVASDRIIIPTQLSLYALDGLNALLNTIAQAKPDRGAEFDWRILLTRIKGHGKVRKAVAWKLLEPIAERVLSTIVRETEAVEDSQSDEESRNIMAVVLARQSGNRGAQDYNAFVKEIETLWPV